MRLNMNYAVKLMPQHVPVSANGILLRRCRNSQDLHVLGQNSSLIHKQHQLKLKQIPLLKAASKQKPKMDALIIQIASGIIHLTNQSHCTLRTSAMPHQMRILTNGQDVGNKVQLHVLLLVSYPTEPTLFQLMITVLLDSWIT
jgi:hypothetical protein